MVELLKDKRDKETKAAQDKERKRVTREEAKKMPEPKRKRRAVVLGPSTPTLSLQSSSSGKQLKICNNLLQKCIGM